MKNLFVFFLPSIFLLVLVTPLITSGCKDATTAQWRSMGTKHRVTLYSGGKVVGTWNSTGNVSNEKHSDGYYFEDDQTHKLVEISGTVVIEQL